MADVAKKLVSIIDHSILQPAYGDEELEEGCLLAWEYEVSAVFVKPCYVRKAFRILKGSEVKVGTVIGFPHGSNSREAKRFEAEQAVKNGAQELDMVINIGALISGDDELVKKDIKAVVDVAHSQGVIVKVILENAYLTDEQKIKGCQISERAGADFVKTSTGFAPSGYTPEDVKLMRSHLSSKTGIKAAGGIRALEQALEAVKLGCSRIGTSSTAAILEEAKKALPNEDR